MPRPDFTSPRLFVAGPLAAGSTMLLDRNQANYLVNVLRLGEGASVLVFNGSAGEWRARLTAPSKKTVALTFVEQTRPQPPTSDVHYCFAPLKHARLDYMIQKAVEMGAGLLQPVLTARTQNFRVNVERMRANAIEAAEQCGVLNVPEVNIEVRLDALLARWPAERLMVFCDEDAEIADPVAALQAAGAGALRTAPIGLIIGPEGGFDDTERAALLRLPHVLRVSLGPRILRADTAAVAALALIQAVVGDWRL